MIFKTAYLFLLASQIMQISGHQIYNEVTEICCGGSVSAKTSEVTSCCGAALYNEEEEACCDGEVQPFPVEGSPHYSCCGRTAYSREQQTCCGGEELHWGASLHCCGLQPYTEAVQECCDDRRLFDRTPGYACCGAVSYYDASKYTYCAIEDEGSVQVEMKDISEKTECCGVTAYNFQEEVCCDGQLLPKPEALGVEEWGVCCGGVVITHHETQLCCGDTIVERNGVATACCGTQQYDEEMQTCCGEEVLDDADRVCCWEAGKTFDPLTQACCGSEVVDLSGDDIDELWVNGVCCNADQAALG